MDWFEETEIRLPVLAFDFRSARTRSTQVQLSFNFRQFLFANPLAFLCVHRPPLLCSLSAKSVCFIVICQSANSHIGIRLPTSGYYWSSAISKCSLPLRTVWIIWISLSAFDYHLDHFRLNFHLCLTDFGSPLGLVRIWSSLWFLCLKLLVGLLMSGTSSKLLKIRRCELPDIAMNYDEPRWTVLQPQTALWWTRWTRTLYAWIAIDYNVR